MTEKKHKTFKAKVGLEAIRMDGRGRALDNIFVERLWRSVKYEDIYLKGYATLSELLLGLTEYSTFSNYEQPHQALGNRTPEALHRSGQGGGATIVDHFSDVPGRRAKLESDSVRHWGNADPLQPRRAV
ncbi:MAG: Mobile element protein [Olavius algarvensis Gamma 1 endosymbiont]|nr:MAG: Mobile element protein [Olavius algarvensis Gamma 1 endosymbiont]